MLEFPFPPVIYIIYSRVFVLAGLGLGYFRRKSQFSLYYESGEFSVRLAFGRDFFEQYGRRQSNSGIGILYFSKRICSLGVFNG